MKTKILIAKVGLSFIQGSIYINENRIDGYFLLDTGCSVNIINKRYVQGNDMRLSQDYELFSPGNISNAHGQVEITFSIENENYTETFTWLEQNHEILDWQEIPVLGIIGLNFLCRNGMVIDYEKLSFHNEDISRSIQLDECKFAFPTDFGLDQYKLPVIGLSNKGSEDDVMAIVDTGANMSIICNNSIERMKYETEELKDKYEILTAGNTKSYIDSVKFPFSLESIREEKLHLVEFTGKFNVNNEDYIFNDEKCKPIEAIIGNMFLVKNQFVLDFGIGLIYCRS